MPENNDFVTLEDTTDGFTIQRELSCGIALRRENFFAMISKNARRESFEFPKGNLKILDGYPESPIECALRKAREEMSFENQIALNGFFYYIHTQYDIAMTTAFSKRHIKE